MDDWRGFDKPQLIAWADRVLGIKLNARKSLENLQAEIMEAADRLGDRDDAPVEASDPDDVARLHDRIAELDQQVRKLEEKVSRRYREGYDEGFEAARANAGQPPSSIPDVPAGEPVRCVVVGKSVYIPDDDVVPPTPPPARMGTTRRVKGDRVTVRDVSVVRAANRRGEVLSVVAPQS